MNIQPLINAALITAGICLGLYVSLLIVGFIGYIINKVKQLWRR